MNEFHYQGQELDLFAKAVNWKSYFRSELLADIGQCVAEVGAGIGSTTLFLCEGKQKVWLCIEPDSQLRQEIDVKILNGMMAACCRTTPAVITELEDSQQFDTILYIDVLEHIKDDAAELRAASGHLIPGGKLIVLAPAHQFLFSDFDRSIGHFRRYNRKSLTSITPRGCQIECAYYLDSLGIAASLANRLFLKQSFPSLNQILFWDRIILPISRYLDKITRFRFGRSVLCIWKKDANVKA